MRIKDTDPKTVAPGDKSAISRLRLLDFDDLFLLGHLLEGATIAATAKQLGLTQPAITQRVRKIERVFGEPILQKAGRHVRLTKEGRAICVKAADALALMREVTTEPSGHAVTVGVGALAGTTWLWPVISELHEQNPKNLYHCYVGAPEELASMLEAGAVDAALTAQGPASGHYGVLDVCDEEYVLVAAPKVADDVLVVADLARHLLLELDRSYSLLSRLDATTRAQARFRDVWFLGAAPNIHAAAVAGHGVGILPASVVRAAIGAGKLRVVLPEVELAPDHYRLVYRKDRGNEALIQELAERLKTRR